MPESMSDNSRGNCRILIVDDHPAVREGLAARIELEAGLDVCGEAENLAEGLRLARCLNPDVAVIDLSLGDSNGMDLIKHLQASDQSVRILVWSMYPDKLYAERVLRLGALGYINKAQTTGRLIDAIQTVCRGEVYLSEEMTRELLQHVVTGNQPITTDPVDTLSDRELEVFRMLGEGMSTATMAEHLSISRHTIETHFLRIKGKLGIKSKIELANVATRWLVGQ